MPQPTPLIPLPIPINPILQRPMTPIKLLLHPALSTKQQRTSLAPRKRPRHEMLLAIHAFPIRLADVPAEVAGPFVVFLTEGAEGVLLPDGFAAGGVPGVDDAEGIGGGGVDGGHGGEGHVLLVGGDCWYSGSRCFGDGD